jgi:hypothetical protein
MTARVIIVALLVALVLILAGCGATTPRLQAVHVPVPVQCQAAVPERPAMPTEALRPGVTLFEFVKAAQAEIERREGYEERLRAALGECVMPLAPLRAPATTPPAPS